MLTDKLTVIYWLKTLKPEQLKIFWNEYARGIKYDTEVVQDGEKVGTYAIDAVFFGQATGAESWINLSTTNEIVHRTTENLDFEYLEDEDIELMARCLDRLL